MFFFMYLIFRKVLLPLLLLEPDDGDKPMLRADALELQGDFGGSNNNSASFLSVEKEEGEAGRLGEHFLLFSFSFLEVDALLEAVDAED